MTHPKIFYVVIKIVNLIELLLSAANFLLDVVVHQVGDVSHQQADVRQLQRQRLELLRQRKVAFEIVLLQESYTNHVSEKV